MLNISSKSHNRWIKPPRSFLSCACVVFTSTAVGSGGEVSAGINVDAAQRLLTNDRHLLKQRRLRIPAGQIPPPPVMDRNLLQPSHLIGLWPGASVSSLGSRCFWQWPIADASRPRLLGGLWRSIVPLGMFEIDAAASSGRPTSTHLHSEWRLRRHSRT